MIMFDPHIHMTSRTTDDYQAMAAAGIAAIVEPAFWLGQPRTHVGTFEDYFLSLVGWERFRAGQFGIRHFCTWASIPRRPTARTSRRASWSFCRSTWKRTAWSRSARSASTIRRRPRTEYFEQQIELALDFELPVLIHTPHRDKKAGTLRTIDLIKASGIAPKRVLIDHNTEETLPLSLDSGCWAGHSIYPNTKMDEVRMVALVKQYGKARIIVNSAADWGVSDPLKVPKTVAAMREAGIADADIETIVWSNPWPSSGRAAGSISASARSIRRRCGRATPYCEADRNPWSSRCRGTARGPHRATLCERQY